MALSQNGRSSRRRTNDAGQPQPTRQARDAGGHLPSAPRERRPLLAALAVLLIVGGALLAGLRDDQTKEEFDSTLAASIAEIYAASIT